MSKFIDSNNREWEFRFSVPKFIKVCRKLNLTLQKVIEMDVPLAESIEAIPILLEEQLKEKGMTANSFLEQMTPSDMGGTLQALRESVQEAFPQAKIGDGESNTPFGPGSSKISSPLPQPQE